MTFASKQITLTFNLAQGTFGISGSNQVVVSGLRCSVKINAAAGTAASTAQIRVFGLTPTVYNALTAIYQVVSAVTANVVTIQAGDATAGSLPIVFVGYITMAQIDLNSQPDVVMNIGAMSGYLGNITPVIPSSFPAGISVAQAMTQLAALMNVPIITNGVTAQLQPGSYYPGTAGTQMAAMARDTGINAQILNGKMVLWQNGVNRPDITKTPVVSYQTNMVGYPTYSTIGIGLKCYYNPDITLGGGVIVISSMDVAQMNGLWQTFQITHTLESEMPDGQWFTECQCRGAAPTGAG